MDNNLNNNDADNLEKNITDDTADTTNTTENIDENTKKIKIGKNKKYSDSLKNAASGILTAAQDERNIKVQFGLIVFALILGMLFKLTKTEIVLVVLAMFFVVFAEMINTAIEAVVDLNTDKFHPKAKVAKDVAAGAVVISVLNAIVIAYFVFFEKIATFGLNYLVSWSTANPTMYFTALIVITLVAIVVLKLISKKISLNKFIPSGQVMIATSIFMAIWSQTKNTIIIASSLIFVMLIASNRIANDRRTICEVVAGAILGIIIASIVYSMIKIIGGGL